MTEHGQSASVVRAGITEKGGIVPSVFTYLLQHAKDYPRLSCLTLFPDPGTKSALF